MLFNIANLMFVNCDVHAQYVTHCLRHYLCMLIKRKSETSFNSFTLICCIVEINMHSPFSSQVTVVSSHNCCVTCNSSCSYYVFIHNMRSFPFS